MKMKTGIIIIVYYGKIIVVDKKNKDQKKMVAKSEKIIWSVGKVSREERERANRHRGLTLWFTGLSGAGKSCLAIMTEETLFKMGCRTFILDGDNVRHGLNSNLGFSPDDRTENIRRIGEVANLLRECGIINLAAFISPYRKDREIARITSGNDGTFLEVFVDCPLEVCEKRDPKGMYKKVRQGLIKHYTGIDAPYEPPSSPEIHLRTDLSPPEDCVAKIIDFLRERNLIGDL